MAPALTAAMAPALTAAMAPALTAAMAPAPATATATATPVAPPEEQGPKVIAAHQQGPRERIEPLGAARYKVQFTASQALVDKLRQAQALLSHRMPSGDLAEILDQALTLLIERLLKERFALGASRGPAPTSATANEPAPIAASGEPAPTTADADGRRCEQTRFLEFHHRVPWG